MTIRTRLALWYAGILTISMIAMGLLSYNEYVVEPRSQRPRQPGPVKGEDSDENDFSDLAKVLLFCGVPAAVLGLGGGWWMTRQALGPVAALTEAARQITEHNWGQHLPRTGNGDELDRLTEVFNDMTDRLSQSFVRIRQFTLHASHELKTPLTVMHGELETALRARALDPAQRERLLSELDEVQRLTKIVDGLTLLTRADAGQITLKREPVRLGELVQEACADARSLARSGDIRVTLTDCEEIDITGDRHRLRQVLLILTDNAVKYNVAGGIITLALNQKADRAELTITNTSNGIPQEVLPRVFERFFRGDPSHNKEVEGCGLGLSIAQWIVQGHGGTIEIASESGKRTSVLVRLPLRSIGTPLISRT